MYVRPSVRAKMDSDEDVHLKDSELKATNPLYVKFELVTSYDREFSVLCVKKITNLHTSLRL